MITPQEALQRTIEHREIFHDEMLHLMRLIMSGELSPVMTAAIVTGLRVKKETIGEITAAAQVMREFSRKVHVADTRQLVDIVGTGGDGANTFNISTCATFVIAAAGGKVSKHGGRSVSSKSGSADAMEALGVHINLTPEQIAECIAATGIGFMFAPNHHPAMKNVAPVRKEMGVNTIFNILGPLTNPAGAPNILMGVFHPDLVGIQVRALQRLGAEHAASASSTSPSSQPIMGPSPACPPEPIGPRSVPAMPAGRGDGAARGTPGPGRAGRRRSPCRTGRRSPDPARPARRRRRRTPAGSAEPERRRSRAASPPAPRRKAAPSGAGAPPPRGRAARRAGTLRAATRRSRRPRRPLQRSRGRRSLRRIDVVPVEERVGCVGQAPRDHRPVHLGGAVDETRLPRVAVDPFERRVLRVAAPAAELDRGVDGAVQRAGPVSFATVVLKRGMTRGRNGHQALWDWFAKVAGGAYAYRMEVEIEMRNGRDEPVLRWALRRALPVKFKAADLNAKGTEVGIEELHLAHEGLVLVS